MKEFDWIARYFAPLASAEGLGLKDDAALFTPDTGKELVITSDAVTAGIHFFEDDNPGSIAQKALRVNLSDLAAKGAVPRGYMLTLLLPFGTKESWIEGFVAGLVSDQTRYGIQLFGGDSCSTQGPLTIAITAIGEVEKGGMLRRNGAQIGDRLYMTGGLGNAALGLKIRKGESIDRAIRRLKKKLDKEGIMRQIRANRYFEKPSERRRRKEARSRIRSV